MARRLGYHLRVNNNQSQRTRSWWRGWDGRWSNGAPSPQLWLGREKAARRWQPAGGDSLECQLTNDISIHIKTPLSHFPSNASFQNKSVVVPLPSLTSPPAPRSPQKNVSAWGPSPTLTQHLSQAAGNVWIQFWGALELAWSSPLSGSGNCFHHHGNPPDRGEGWGLTLQWKEGRPHPY